MKAVPPRDADDWPADDVEEATESSPPLSDVAGLGLSVLIVDDDPKNLTAMEVALADLDVDQVQVRSGEEALRELLRKDFAIILLDVQMPEMDGFETARLIRSRKKNRYVPIIFVTAFSHDDEDMRRGYELGAVDYLFKPIMPEVLRAKVQGLVELRRRTIQIQEQARRLREMERVEAEHRLNEERRRWEADALRTQNQQLADSDRKKDEFLAVLAHELRNPLAPLVNALESMTLLGLPNDDLRRVHGVMERQVVHLNRLVDDLLDVSRISRGKLELRCEVIEWGQVIRDAVEACRPQFEQRQQQFFVEGPEDRGAVYGDKVRLVQMTVNLLTNASRYTDEGGEIRLVWGLDDGEEEDGQAFVRVSDTGKGIAPEARERIFDMFVQERGGGRGLGLGLTLVRQIVQMHQGTVKVESPGVNRGSVFEVRMPRAELTFSGTETSGDTGTLEIELESSERPIPSPARRARRVVLIEDDADVRETLVLLLEQWGHEVETACTGQEGVELVKKVRPEIAFLDIGLPGMSGHDAAAQLVREMGAERPKLIALSGYGQKRDRQRSRDAGFDTHLVKPAEPKELQKLLDELD